MFGTGQFSNQCVAMKTRKSVNGEVRLRVWLEKEVLISPRVTRS